MAPIVERAQTEAQEFIHKVKTNPTLHKVVDTVKKVAIGTLFAVGVGACLYMSPSFFLIGAVVGAIFPDNVHQLRERVVSVWEHNTTNKVILATSGVVALILVLPTGIASFSALTGSICAEWLVSRSQPGS